MLLIGSYPKEHRKCSDSRCEFGEDDNQERGSIKAEHLDESMPAFRPAACLLSQLRCAFGGEVAVSIQMTFESAPSYDPVPLFIDFCVHSYTPGRHLLGSPFCWPATAVGWEVSLNEIYSQDDLLFTSHRRRCGHRAKC